MNLVFDLPTAGGPFGASARAAAATAASPARIDDSRARRDAAFDDQLEQALAAARQDRKERARTTADSVADDRRAPADAPLRMRDAREPAPRPDTPAADRTSGRPPADAARETANQTDTPARQTASAHDAAPAHDAAQAGDTSEAGAATHPADATAEGHVDTAAGDDGGADAATAPVAGAPVAGGGTNATSKTTASGAPAAAGHQAAAPANSQSEGAAVVAATANQLATAAATAGALTGVMAPANGAAVADLPTGVSAAADGDIAETSADLLDEMTGEAGAEGGDAGASQGGDARAGSHQAPFAHRDSSTAGQDTRTVVQGAALGAVRDADLQPARAATAAAPLMEPPGPDQADRIVQSLRLQFQRGGGDAIVQLNPEHLGPVSISLRVEHGAVTAQVLAENPVVAEWLQANEHSLRDALKSSGLLLTRLVVNRDGQAQEQATGRDPAQARRDQRRRLAQAHSTFEITV